MEPSLPHAGSLVAACEIYFPEQGSNPGLLHWEPGVLTTGPQGKSWEGVIYLALYSVFLMYQDVKIETKSVDIRHQK